MCLPGEGDTCIRNRIEWRPSKRIEPLRRHSLKKPDGNPTIDSQSTRGMTMGLIELPMMEKQRFRISLWERSSQLPGAVR